MLTVLSCLAFALYFYYIYFPAILLDFVFCISVTNVGSLLPATTGHNIIVKVMSFKVVVEKTRSDGSQARVAEALVGDQTGCVLLTARGSMRIITNY